MKVIVGLGNPGKKYQLTRHNIGFIAIDQIALRLNAMTIKSSSNSWLAKADFRGEKIILSQPTTYMNLSGQAILELKKFYRLDLNDFMVISDDVYLPFGVIKMLPQGGDGGHNGLKSVINLVGKQFHRLRIGVGISHMEDKEDNRRPQNQIPLDRYVLGSFSSYEQKQLPEYANFITDLMLYFLENGIESTMSRFNKRSYQEGPLPSSNHE